MTTVAKWIVSAGIAFGMQLCLDAVLPTEMPRIWVLIVGGAAYSIWSKIDDVVRA